MEVNKQILGLSEVKWFVSGTTNTMNKPLFYSSNSDDPVTNFPPVSNRNMLIQLSGKPMNINIIQTYIPTINIRRNWRLGTENWKNYKKL